LGKGSRSVSPPCQATGHPASAALATSGLRTLDLPTDAREVTVLADGDDPGEAAARDAALRWKREARPERQ
jgi:putative DNA primase/helicase